jgi:glutamine synthetase
MKAIPELFGSMVFNEAVMRDRLPKETFKSLKSTLEKGEPLNSEIANVVANAMKEWAIEKGATHYTHWFQPMTGMTAEKHDSFISPEAGGTVIMEFSGKELIKGEPDASSFPSGGLRSTFEARGYTAWDPTSYAFVKDGVLCIPTAFCSYSGEALDQKTPLLKSMEVINKQALRILNIFGTKAKRVLTTVGPEQEYFLVDKAVFEARPDLMNCGRTLFGARPAKGQELSDHYFGAIKPRVTAFMRELNEELWKLGINAKTEHNEVAPAQHELAPVFATTNIAIDHNQLTMELMKKVAMKHDMACLLHEKPFAGVNGSGKHNNWSLCTDTGINLLDPGKTPAENVQFLLVLAAVIKAVDEYQDLLRMSVASAGNDHRLGANEAPPAIISMFLGDELTAVLEDIEAGKIHKDAGRRYMEIGAAVLPSFPMDNTDRNRTSPFAFTGNKFEFRMVGSSQSVSMANTVLNTIVAEELSQFADVLETSGDIAADVNKIVVETLKEHKRIIFNGNNYSDAWVVEAERRGLLNLRSTAEAIAAFVQPKNVALFEKYGVFTEAEMRSRSEIMLDNYCKTLHIEALTMIDMTKKSILPSVLKYQGMLADTAASKKMVNEHISTELEEKLLDTISKLSICLYNNLEALESAVIRANDIADVQEKAFFYREEVFAKMAALRGVADELELTVGEEYWAFPTYSDLLYSVK